MIFRGGSYGFLFLAWGLFLSVVPASSAQSGSAPKAVMTDQQLSGEAYFYQNCTLCHVYSGQKKALGLQASSELKGLFKSPSTSEASVRQVIQKGIPGMMPGFQYTLEGKQLDDLIAYLKVR